MSHHSEPINGTRSWMDHTRPMKLTECWRLRVGRTGWGALADYTLESVKVARREGGRAASAAVLRVADRAGHISCAVKGLDVGLLFGLTRDEWKGMENLTRDTGELFYRNFRNGPKEDFPIEQKMFYYFCHSQQIKDLLFVEFMRSESVRKVDRNGAFLQILKVHKCTPHLLKLYNAGFKLIDPLKVD